MQCSVGCCRIQEAVISAQAKVKGRGAIVAQTSRFHTQLTHLGNTQANHHVMSESKSFLIKAPKAPGACMNETSLRGDAGPHWLSYEEMC